jgi:hypothetical protein
MGNVGLDERVPASRPRRHDHAHDGLMEYNNSMTYLLAVIALMRILIV